MNVIYHKAQKQYGFMVITLKKNYLGYVYVLKMINGYVHIPKVIF